MKKSTNLYKIHNEALEQEIAQEHSALLTRSKELGKEHAQLSQHYKRPNLNHIWVK